MKYAEEIQRATAGLCGLRPFDKDRHLCAFKQCDEPVNNRLPLQMLSCPSPFFCREHLVDLKRRIEELNFAAFIEGIERTGAELSGQELVVTVSCAERRCCVPGCEGIAPGGGWRFEPYKAGEFYTCAQHWPAVQYMLDQQLATRVLLELMQRKKTANPKRNNLRLAILNAYKQSGKGKGYSEYICAALQKQKAPIPEEWLKLWQKRRIAVDRYDWKAAYDDPQARKTIQQHFSRIVNSTRNNSHSPKSS